MTKKYIAPQSNDIALFTEGEIALNLNSGGDSINNKGEFLSNDKAGGTSPPPEWEKRAPAGFTPLLSGRKRAVRK